MLFDLASAGGLEDKRSRMATGQHINSTEDRPGMGYRVIITLFSWRVDHKISFACFLIAVMHIALRAPSSKRIFVDGIDVVPQVHEVLTKVLLMWSTVPPFIKTAEQR